MQIVCEVLYCNFLEIAELKQRIEQVSLGDRIDYLTVFNIRESATICFFQGPNGYLAGNYKLGVFFRRKEFSFTSFVS